MQMIYDRLFANSRQVIIKSNLIAGQVTLTMEVIAGGDEGIYCTDHILRNRQGYTYLFKHTVPTVQDYEIVNNYLHSRVCKCGVINLASFSAECLCGRLGRQEIQVGYYC